MGAWLRQGAYIKGHLFRPTAVPARFGGEKMLGLCTQCRYGTGAHMEPRYESYDRALWDPPRRQDLHRGLSFPKP
ncbi:hypothetical protein J2R96_002080 [Bradyrhizobium elkanii]|nr:hypothetical protein [Bradyrhizobium elkanii]